MKRIGRVLLAASAVPVLAYAALALAVGRDAVWETAFGPPARPPVEFRGLSLADDARPNRFLMCPPGLCAGPVHAESPVFPAAPADLRAAWERAAARVPNLRRLDAGEDPMQAEYEARTPVLRFPDTVTVRFMPADGGGSTLAVFGRSHYGYDDLGVNEARIRTLVEATAAELRG
jgi:uncharacterized protein (DUF1499 family)